MDDTETLSPHAAKHGSALALFGKKTGWFFSPHHFRFKLLSGTAVGVVVIIFLAAVVAFRNHQQGVLRTHTIEVIRLGSLIENDLDALKAGHRGFLLTGNEIYLETFNRRREQIRRRMDELTGLIVEKSPQRKRIMKAQELVQNWLQIVAIPEIEKTQSSQSGAAKDANSNAPINVSLGTSMLEEARTNLQSVQDEEQSLLNRKTR